MSLAYLNFNPFNFILKLRFAVKPQRRPVRFLYPKVVPIPVDSMNIVPLQKRQRQESDQKGTIFLQSQADRFYQLLLFYAFSVVLIPNCLCLRFFHILVITTSSNRYVLHLILAEHIGL